MLNCSLTELHYWNKRRKRYFDSNISGMEEDWRHIEESEGDCEHQDAKLRKAQG
jgi:hypothetical protein